MSMSSSSAAAVPTFTLPREDPWALPLRGHLQVVREAAPQRYAAEVEEKEEQNEDDILEALGDEIATLAAHIHAATHRMLQLIAEFDERRGWERDGHRTCAHWLAFRTGSDLGTAREKVRVARALRDLPLISASMARGELSFSKVRALTRVATEENEAELLEVAHGCTTAQLERILRSWRRGNRKDEAARERERHEARSFAVFPDDDGMYVVKGRLEPEVAAVIMKAIDAASQALWRQDPDGPAARMASEEETLWAAAQRRADALGLVAERALAAGFGGGADDAPISGTRAARFQVVLHVDAETLAEEDSSEADPATTGDARPGPRSHLEDGTRVSAETSRRLACDCGLVPVTRAGRLRPGHRAPDADHPPRATARAGGAGPGLPLPRMWFALHRRASPRALGRRGRDQPGQHAPALPSPPPARPRRRLAGHVVGRGAAGLRGSAGRGALRRQVAGRGVRFRAGAGGEQPGAGGGGGLADGFGAVEGGGGCSGSRVVQGDGGGGVGVALLRFEGPHGSVACPRPPPGWPHRIPALMQLYRGSAQFFVQDSRHNAIADKLTTAFETHFRHRPSPAEVASWRNSLRAMSDVLLQGELLETSIVLEYQLPAHEPQTRLHGPGSRSICPGSCRHR